MDVSETWGESEPWESIEARLRAVRVGEIKSDAPDRIEAQLARAAPRAFAGQVAAAGRGRVLFLCRRPYFTIVRQALALRARGWSPFLAHLEPIEPAIEASLQGALDEAFVARLPLPNSIALLETLVARLPVDVVHFQCWMFDYFTPAALLRSRARTGARVPMVVEFYDVTSLYGTRADLLARFSPDAVALDLALEGLLMREADAVVLRFGDEAIERLRRRHGGPQRALTFWPYPSPRFIHYRDERTPPPPGPPGKRAVYAGGLFAIKPDRPRGLFPAEGLLPMFEKLLAQDFSIDVLHDPYRPLARAGPELRPYFALAEAKPSFRLFDGVGVHQLAARMCGYDLALNLFDIPPACAELRAELVTSGIGTKLFAYLEAGLPVIVNREYQGTADLVTREGIGLAVHSRDIDHLGALVAAADHDALRHAVRRYNTEHGMEREIERIEALYRRLGAAG